MMDGKIIKTPLMKDVAVMTFTVIAENREEIDLVEKALLKLARKLPKK